MPLLGSICTMDVLFLLALGAASVHYFMVFYNSGPGAAAGVRWGRASGAAPKSSTNSAWVWGVFPGEWNSTWRHGGVSRQG
jgi:hypothetical protein